jgi:hypothetical protein
VGWHKQGRIFEPSGQASWIGTHAALPVAEPTATGHRIYFSSRDGQGRSHIGYGELAHHEPFTLERLSPEPVLSPGALGAFDDAGVTSSCLVQRDRRRFFYYTGWSLGVSVPFYLSAGLAVSDSDGPFVRVSQAPLLDRCAVDPYLTASPWVIAEETRWRMWYVSATEWALIDGRPRHKYLIKYAESADGIVWNRTGVVCIDYKSHEEHAIARPCVVKDGDRYRMWYSYRGDAYRIGYAESDDGIRWVRRDDIAGIGVSADGWDAAMVGYAFVFDDGPRRYMLYNGNDYGRTGIGLAVHDGL